MHRRSALFTPADVQTAGVDLDLVPLQIAQLGSSKPILALALLVLPYFAMMPGMGMGIAPKCNVMFCFPACLRAVAMTHGRNCATCKTPRRRSGSNCS